MPFLQRGKGEGRDPLKHRCAVICEHYAASFTPCCRDAFTSCWLQLPREGTDRIPHSAFRIHRHETSGVPCKPISFFFLLSLQALSSLMYSLSSLSASLFQPIFAIVVFGFGPFHASRNGVDPPVPHPSCVVLSCCSPFFVLRITSALPCCLAGVAGLFGERNLGWDTEDRHREEGGRWGKRPKRETKETTEKKEVETGARARLRRH